MGPATFGYLRCLPGRGWREAHLNGKVAAALMASVGDIIEPPTIEKVDVLAAKLPVAASA